MFCSNSTAHVAMRKLAFFLADSIDLIVIRSVMYTIVKVIRIEMKNNESIYALDICLFTFKIDELRYWALKCSLLQK